MVSVYINRTSCGARCDVDPGYAREGDVNKGVHATTVNWEGDADGEGTVVGASACLSCVVMVAVVVGTVRARQWQSSTA